MGSGTSKAARTAAGAAQRKYPTRAPTTSRPAPSTSSAPPPPPRPRNDPHRSIPTSAPPPSPANRGASSDKNSSIDLDGRDPQLAAHLRTLGPVQPNTTYSPSSTSSSGGRDASPSTPPPTNPALTILAARRRIQEEVDADMVGSRAGGRRYVDVATVRKALVLRDEQGMGVEEVERYLGLRRGVVGGLGPRGVVEVA